MSCGDGDDGGCSEGIEHSSLTEEQNIMEKENEKIKQIQSAMDKVSREVAKGQGKLEKAVEKMTFILRKIRFIVKGRCLVIDPNVEDFDDLEHPGEEWDDTIEDFERDAGAEVISSLLDRMNSHGLYQVLLVVNEMPMFFFTEISACRSCLTSVKQVTSVGVGAAQPGIASLNMQLQKILFFFQRIERLSGTFFSKNFRTDIATEYDLKGFEDEMIEEEMTIMETSEDGLVDGFDNLDARGVILRRVKWIEKVIATQGATFSDEQLHNFLHDVYLLLIRQHAQLVKRVLNSLATVQEIVHPM
ncbi:hypothetical protein GLAREA_00846 [Glarea lozoyensis ATCC 20868]|uniref:Uncharacterized protein n=1 Tax=Glarea lozoyensis (strain ATCC 20868 / MF5171) TaxID=1116229 RepID=S3DCF1_GLAL2|nr:uncharacterized protein GLAREA_00846 [Glarea lozoyensis ATCC 20868]EPE29686.1 hypothetical protein GLAREA_00846 [Glarea lozoyensis ATCC 20868]